MNELDQGLLRTACLQAQANGWTIAPNVFIDRENKRCCPSGAWTMFQDGSELSGSDLAGFPAGFDGADISYLWQYIDTPKYAKFKAYYAVGQAFRKEFCPS